MTSGQLVQGKLQAWARRQRIQLQGSVGDRGAPNYTLSTEDNLFGGVLLPAVKAAFEEGAGGELRGTIPTMSALHSSAAMAVNLFQYWLSIGDVSTLARLLEIPSQHIVSAAFEDRFPVCEAPREKGFPTDPHLDFAFRYADGRRVGVECKLFEPYGRLDPKPLRRTYLNLESAWDDIPACRMLASQLAEGLGDYQRLGARQLVKHILGLKAGLSTTNWRLMYLYLDAPGDGAAEHRAELRRFQDAIAPDDVSFRPTTVQELILRTLARARPEDVDYVNYLAERYL